jgi:hypothetical protein
MVSTSGPLFVNGEGMRSGAVHHTIDAHPFLGHVRSAPKYRFFSDGDRFPPMWLVDQGGVCIPGKLYDVPLTTIRDQFIPAEPPELELGVIELAGGESALAVLLRWKGPGHHRPDGQCRSGGWRAYRSRQDDSR